MLETALGSNHGASTHVLRIFVDRHPYPSAHTSDRAIMSSKHKSKEAKSSKKDPEKEKGKGKGKEKEGDKDKTKKEKMQVISLSVALYLVQVNLATYKKAAERGNQSCSSPYILTGHIALLLSVHSSICRLYHWLL
jgi:hypothetical protein